MNNGSILYRYAAASGHRARAVNEPQVLFLDEPTKGVDPINAQILLGLIRERVAGTFKKTVLMTTHPSDGSGGDL
ncbi:MAG: hypothetical protein U0231_18905 [Nitrospiraceae bacterium]